MILNCNKVNITCWFNRWYDYP